MSWFGGPFLLMLPLAAAVVIVLGDRYARLVAGGQLLAFFATLVARGVGPTRFTSVPVAIVVVDVAILLLVSHAALRTRRTWIILTASMLLLPPLGHFAKLVDTRLGPGGYWLMTSLPAIPCLLLLIGQAWLLTRRRRTAGAISRRS